MPVSRNPLSPGAAPSLLENGTPLHVWLRAPSSRQDARTVLTPSDARTLVRRGFLVTVEASNSGETKGDTTTSRNTVVFTHLSFQPQPPCLQVPMLIRSFLVASMMKRIDRLDVMWFLQDLGLVHPSRRLSLA